MGCRFGLSRDALPLFQKDSDQELDAAFDVSEVDHFAGTMDIAVGDADDTGRDATGVGLDGSCVGRATLEDLELERDAVFLCRLDEQVADGRRRDHPGVLDLDGGPFAQTDVQNVAFRGITPGLSLIHISEPTRLGMISYAVFCLKKKK